MGESEEMCLFPGMQYKHRDSSAEVALPPFISGQKAESGNLLQSQVTELSRGTSGPAAATTH